MIIRIKFINVTNLINQTTRWSSGRSICCSCTRPGIESGQGYFYYEIVMNYEIYALTCDMCSNLLTKKQQNIQVE